MKGIQNSGIHIFFVSLAVEDSDRLRKLLVQENYTLSILNPNDIPTPPKTANKPLLLIFMSGHPSSDKRVVSLLQNNAMHMPCLCVVNQPNTVFEDAVLYNDCEFVIWPCASAEFFFRLRRAAACYADRHAGSRQEYPNVMGSASTFLRVMKLAKVYSACDAPVLIEGETGTGKEMLARAIHYYSERHGHPFIPVNCGALPDNLIENELFGHEKGAYTDAKAASGGIIKQAEGGTLFLDEVEALSPKGQVALLRFLQEKEYKPLGSGKSIKANVRIISATNQPLGMLAAQGKLRQDLLYRLNILSVTLPPLRERGDDVLLLAEYFLRKYRAQYKQYDKVLHTGSVQWLKNYSWPGNVRELENLIHRAFLVADGAIIYSDDFTDNLDQHIFSEQVHEIDFSLPPDVSFNHAKSHVLNAFERQYLCRLMTQTGGNVTLAAKKACKERRAFGKLLKKHGIDRVDYL